MEMRNERCFMENTKAITSSIEKEFHDIMTKAEPELQNIAYNYLRNWAVVEDVIQEVYLKLFLNLSKINK